MVVGEHQPVLGRAQRDEHEPDQRRAGGVPGAVQLGPGRGGHLPLLLDARAGRHVDVLPAEDDVLGHHLDDGTGGRGGQDAAQRGAAGQQLLGGVAQASRVEGADEVVHALDEVDLGLALVAGQAVHDEPGLQVGGGEGLADAQPVLQRVHVGRVDEDLGRLLLVVRPLVRLPREGGQGRDVGRRQQLAGTELEAVRPQARAHGDRGDAVAADPDEVVVHPDPVQPEDVGEDLAQDPLLRGARGPSRPGRRGRREGEAVELAAGGGR